MLRKKGTLRRVSAAFAVAVGIMAITGPGASAGANGLPEILNGHADSQALRVDLVLPSVGSLNNALTELGLGAVQIPLDDDLLGNQFTQIISLNHGEVLRSAKKTVADHASGFAAPLQGLLGGVDKVTSRCDGSGCGGAESSKGLEVKVLDGIIPGGLGTIRVARADSITKSLVDTRNISGLAEVELSLANLFDIEALAPLAEALNTLRTTVNDALESTVNPVLDQVGDVVAGVIEGTPLEGHVSVGGVNPIPDFTQVDLLDLEVLPAYANVRPFTPKSGPGKGVKGLLAESRAKIANLEILGDGDNAWAHLGAVGLDTSAFANGVKGAATGEADVNIVDMDLGGLLGLNIPTDTLVDLTNGTAVKEVIKNLGLPAEADLLNAVDLIYNTAGISIDTFGKNVNVDPKGNFASATAGTIRIVIEPKVPNPAKVLDAIGDGIVPKLEKSDFVSTGLMLAVTLPNASSAASIGKVLPEEFPPPPRTGVGTPLIAGVLLIGSAAMVRRFALAK